MALNDPHVGKVSKPKGRFFWFVYAKGIPKEPSLWFAIYVVCLKSDMPHH